MRLGRLVTQLERFYGQLPRPPKDPFGFYAWEVLSAQTTAGRRDAALGALRRIRALTPDSFSRAAPARLASAVALAGPYAEQRLQALRTAADAFRRSPKLPEIIAGPLVAARRALRRLPKLDRAGARRMLLFTTDRALFPDDPLVIRVGSRLGYGGHTRPDKSGRSVVRALVTELPRDVEAFRSAFLYLSHHAVAACTADKPRCRVCPLVAECEYVSSARQSASGSS